MKCCQMAPSSQVVRQAGIQRDVTANDVICSSSALRGCQGNSLGATVNQTFQKIKYRGFKSLLNLGLVGFGTIFWPKNTLQAVLAFPDDLSCDFRLRHAASTRDLFDILKVIVPPCSPLSTPIVVSVKYPRRKSLPVGLRELVSMTTAGTLCWRCSGRVRLNVHCHLVAD